MNELNAGFWGCVILANLYLFNDHAIAGFVFLGFASIQAIIVLAEMINEVRQK